MGEGRLSVSAHWGASCPRQGSLLPTLTPVRPQTNLLPEAKRWLKALRAGDAEARARLARAYPAAPARPALRDVQYALAQEYGHESWITLTSALATLTARARCSNGIRLIGSRASAEPVERPAQHVLVRRLVAAASSTMWAFKSVPIRNPHLRTCATSSNRLRRVFVCSLLCCLLAVMNAAMGRALDPASFRQAQQPYRERVDVPRVLVDVRVLDGSGKPIKGLTRADFSVKIDGKVSAVDTAEWVSPQSETGRETQSTVSEVATPRNGRWIVLLYQKKPDLSDVEGIMRLRRDFTALAHIVSDDDQVAIKRPECRCSASTLRKRTITRGKRDSR